jgi:hypothetical protein
MAPISQSCNVLHVNYISKDNKARSASIFAISRPIIYDFLTQIIHYLLCNCIDTAFVTNINNFYHCASTIEIHLHNNWICSSVQFRNKNILPWKPTNEEITIKRTCSVKAHHLHVTADEKPVQQSNGFSRHEANYNCSSLHIISLTDNAGVEPVRGHLHAWLAHIIAR